ncbi:MAG TPA: tRNA (adenosine(37)-N6)-threonylcarbamoyltransferase complex dimerization subunit type 1 TsaB, partial [Candidatus Dormibacteraeota bacterium]|nr:tRNA (adenosine(37)-N6)-threonylcarbamoyltransferase complex dimerization subunit type 1 TsaB [Candidatus Dormibacteraeota bacterium]
MVLVIDTSSVYSALAVLSADGGVVAELVEPSGRGFDLAGRVAELTDIRAIESIVVATGPGSFTGLRVGAAYALGLSVARRLRLMGISSLTLAAG